MDLVNMRTLLKTLSILTHCQSNNEETSTMREKKDYIEILIDVAETDTRQRITWTQNYLDNDGLV